MDMSQSIDRRTALLAAGTIAAAGGATAGSAAKPRADTRGANMPPMASMLPDTDYFEIDSVHAKARYAIWVTTPPGYARDASRRYPAVYATDGNWTAPMIIGNLPLLPSDPINPIVPIVHIAVGFPPDEAPHTLAIRARDLLPPSEPAPPGADETSLRVLIDQGLLDEAGVKRYAHYLHNPAGDKFLAFLTEELHPLLAGRYRIDADQAGLFGYSFGGLFSTYVAMRRTGLFRKIGAGSSGIMPGKSKVFELYAAELAAKADHKGRMLHMTVNERELTYPSYYQYLVGAGTTEFMTLASTTPLPGLSFSSRIFPEESHASGAMTSWFSFMRTCYAAR